MTAEIVVVDYGMGNVLSVRNALAKIGAEAALSDDPQVLEAAAGVILPGVGGFPDCMRALEAAGLTGPLRRVIGGASPISGYASAFRFFSKKARSSAPRRGWESSPGACGVFPRG